MSEAMAGEHGMSAAEFDVSGMDLGSLIDVAEIQPVLDSFTKLTGMVTAVLDVDGKVVIATGWREICLEFHRKNPASAAHCTKSDCYLSRELRKGEYVDYRCDNGLWDVVTPLFLGDRHVGNVFSGQYFYDTDVVDEASFVDRAERYGFDRESYLRALRLVPRYDRRTIETLMEYLVGYFTQVSKKSYATIALARQYAELESAREASKKSEATLRYVLDTIPQSVFWKDVSGRYLGCNYAFARTVGLSAPEEILGKSDLDLPWPKPDAEAYRADDARVIADRICKKHIVERVQSSDGERMWVDTTKLPMIRDDGEAYGVLGVYDDITERKRAEERIEGLLAEKELILREVHHRIKNNMSTMSGLLTLRSAGLTDPSAVAAFDDAKRCMQSMAFLYDRLYKSGGGSDLPVRRYLDSLVDEILGNFPGIELIRVEKRLDDFMLDAVRLQPLGIILNELLTNAMKYAFPAGTGGTITVSALLRDGRASVSVRDDGGGIPEGVDAGRSSGFGLTLVGALAEQLGGTIGIARDGGTAVTVEFDL